MSGPSRSLSSRVSRNALNSPYAGRPASKKPSSNWSFSSLLGHFNPIRSLYALYRENGDVDPAAALSQRGEELASIINEDRSIRVDADEEVQMLDEAPVQAQAARVPTEPPASPSPQTSPDTSLISIMAKSSSNFETVTSFLKEKGTSPLNPVEFAGLVSLLQDSVQDDGSSQQPFRFSASPSAPVQGSSSLYNFTAPGTSASTSSVSTTGSKKVLSKNPNGTYRFQGGGSSRPRNRYQSPVFGRPQSPATRIIITPEKPKTDSKRRRTGAAQPDASTSTAQQGTASTSNGRPVTNGTTEASTSLPNLNGGPASSSSSPSVSAGVVTSSSASRIRTAGTTKPTAPAVPSPLRQAWGQSDSPPQSSRQTQQPVRPTRAASTLTEILKEVTPPKRPEFANPYETASPIPLRAAAKKPAAQRRTRSAAKAATSASQHKEKEKEKPAQKPEQKLTAQEIIEATVPKGSKRSRPPPELKTIKTDAPSVSTSNSTLAEPQTPRRSARLLSPEPAAPANGINGRSKSTVEIEEISDEELPSPPKKQRTTTFGTTTTTIASVDISNGHSASPKVTVEEVRDEVMSDGTSSDGLSLAPQNTTSYVRPSEVIEPPEESTGGRSQSTSPTAESAATNGLTAPGSRALFPSLKSSAPRAPSKLRFSFQADKDEKEKDVEMRVQPTPTSTTTPSTSIQSISTAQAQVKTQAVAPASRDAKAMVKTMAVTELPTYTVQLSISFPSGSTDAKAGPGPRSLKAREAAKALPVSSLPSYDFFFSGSSASSASTSAAGPAASSKVVGFDWAAAGLKKPNASNGGSTWTCAECALQNPSTALEKCTICEAPRLGVAPKQPASGPPAPAAPAGASTNGGFNWATAGMKPPGSQTNGGMWTCGTCMLSNPTSALKCTICDAPR